MSLPSPYYRDDSVTLYHGDALEIMPGLGRFDLVLTDPPYGISRDKGMGGGGYSFGNKTKRTPKLYAGDWDSERPSTQTMSAVLEASDMHIVWGGNYFADVLPVAPKWLVWDKRQTMPSYSDAELAWTTLPGVSVKMFRYCGAGLMAVEKTRQHPTQKPLALMLWCLEKAPRAMSVLDPFAGSGTTGRACKDLGRKCVLIERAEQYCEVIANRMGQEVLAL